MRRISTLLLLLAITTLCLKAQKPIMVYEDTLLFGNSPIPGLTVNIPEADYEKSLKNWIKEQESGTRSKVITESNGMSIFGANIKDISSSPVNIYSTMIKQDTTMLLSVAFELKKDEYIDKYTAEAELVKAKAYLFNFSKNQYLDFVGEELKAEQAKLRNIERDLSSLQTRESRMSRALGKNNSTVQREKERLISLNNDLTTASADIAEHSSQLNTMLPGTARDEKEKYIKGLEKDRKKLQKSIRSSENKMKKASSAIDKAGRELPRNDKTQDRIREQLSAQEAVVRRYTDKLNRIKAFK